jgi:hypothetical protein
MSLGKPGPPPPQLKMEAPDLFVALKGIWQRHGFAFENLVVLSLILSVIDT